MSLKHILGGLAAALILAFAAAPAVRADDTPAAAATAAAAPATASAPAAPSDAPPGSTAHETVDNPYGLQALWKGGDFVAHGTLTILMIMSLGTWYILVTKLIEQSKVLKAAREAQDSFWSAATVTEGTAALAEASPFRYIAETGLSANDHHEGKLVEAIDRHSWVTMSIQRAVDLIAARSSEGLTFLATVGSTAPFVGLFGTVWGIYNALTAIGIAGQASIDKVAGPVGEALIMTAIGLAVAVPAVLGYNWLVRRNKTAMEKVRTFGADLHSILIAGARVGARS
ncbi:MAG: MotA/TolQ/ExbB proton channel family protein [Pseudomonadota bacterium]|nr:MotA/TolQ/ExbB proton channel family protein [Pseudomonadota bacterium]